MRSRLSILAAASTVLAALGVMVPAQAAENIRESVSFEPFPVLTCDGGEVITVGFDLDRTMHNTYAEDGELTLQKRTINYTGTFRVEGTDLAYPFRGTRIVTLDFANNRFISTGNVRTVTVPGEGVVFHYTGRVVDDLETGELLFSSGPKFWEADYDVNPDPAVKAALCGTIFGLEP